MRRAGVALVLVALAAACATSTVDAPIVAPAADAPERFLVLPPGEGGPRPPAPGEGCRNPLVDPRDGTRIRLVRSAGGVGDYEVAAGRYGAGEGRLLRVECATGRPQGLVRR